MLFYLASQYPKAAIFGLARFGLTLVAIPLISICKFLLWKYRPSKRHDRGEPKKCSKIACYICAARGQHPKWFNSMFSAKNYTN
ncbi:uncharacterized protein DI49_1634 [Saccharomyces eubayanus]|uniref:uncharacterized protein n=1 Tax=Saccharomyces eubayanus TaxID=1080349 RepID=UPI0006BF043E|nr:hypothetical protein DI49_1634 [Saccharomyces eubayanus]KOG99800.1 hypothetical protein DI49_1634 [Saccharomyces eubayanus]